VHDWKRIVREKFRALGALSTELSEQITEELAGHLEDAYEEHLREGLPPQAAFARAVTQITPGSRISRRIRLEALMNDFTRKVALPGLLTFASAMAMAWVLDMAHIQPKTILLANGLFLSVPIAWLFLLPFCGFAGAIVSQRNGGSRLHRIAACLFPSAIMGAVLLFIFAAGFVISRFAPDSGWNWALAVPGLALGLTGQTILTGIPLLLGAGAGEKMNRMPRHG
jgi:hypothetical protein